MAYGDSSRVRQLAGNMSTTNLSAADVTQSIVYGDSMVNTFTAKDDWNSNDVEYGMIQTASEYFAASYCVKRLFTGDKSTVDRARALEEQAHMILGTLRKSSANLIHVVSSSYRTYPLNESATPYRSMSGANNSVDDSDL